MNGPFPGNGEERQGSRASRRRSPPLAGRGGPLSPGGRAVGLVLTAIVSVQLGAAFAKMLFDSVSPTAMVWLRLAFSCLVLLLVARPVVRGRSGGDWAVVVGFGAALATMNWAIYQSFARMPLGVAVTIEFLGPLLLALVLSRRRRDLLWVALAGLGVALLGLDGDGVTVAGTLFALLAGAAWAAYILLSAATGRRWPGLSGLAIASVVGTVVLAVPATAGAGDRLIDPWVLAVGFAVALLSSVVPYSCELVALRTLPTGVFGVLMSLEPAAAALAGILVLQEWLGPWEWVAVACVVAASVGVTRSGSVTVPTD